MKHLKYRILFMRPPYEHESPYLVRQEFRARIVFALVIMALILQVPILLKTLGWW